MTIKSIWKFPTPIGDFEGDIPEGASFLSIQAQGDAVVQWWLVDLEAKPVRRRFHIVGTGWTSPVLDKWNYLGTVQVKGLVWHYFVEEVI